MVDWDPRVVADYGFWYGAGDCPPEGEAYRVWETWIAFTTKRRAAVCIGERPARDPTTGEFIKCSQGGLEIRIALGDNESAAWRSSAFLPATNPGDPGREDPVILVTDPNPSNPSDPEFGIWAKTQSNVRMMRWRPSTGFSGWNAVPDTSVSPLDKPWVVRGESQELYLIYFGGSFGSAPIRYARSVDNGADWEGGQVLVGGNPVIAGFCAQPTVAGSGPLYVAYRSDVGTTWRFLEGSDAVGGLVDWASLQQPSGGPLVFPFNLNDTLPIPWEPNFGEYPSANKPMPFLLADPTNADRLYLVYHDVADDDPGDMNVYCARLQRSGSAWSYGPGDVFLVNSVNAPVISGMKPDSFLPSAAIDRFGRIHAIFYDNRLACGATAYEGVYDVYYALSEHDAGGELTGFSNHLLRDCTQHPFMDSELLVSTDDGLFFQAWFPKEYNGISLDDSGHETIVWTSYSMLVYGEDPSIHPSAIGASRVLVSNPSP